MREGSGHPAPDTPGGGGPALTPAKTGDTRVSSNDRRRWRRQHGRRAARRRAGGFPAGQRGQALMNQRVQRQGFAHVRTPCLNGRMSTRAYTPAATYGSASAQARASQRIKVSDNHAAHKTGRAGVMLSMAAGRLGQATGVAQSGQPGQVCRGRAARRCSREFGTSWPMMT